MTRDISDLLADAVEDRARSLGDLRPSPAAFAFARVRIRRRRIVRHSLQAVAGVAAAGIVATGAWLGLAPDRAPTPPIDTPTSSPEPSTAAPTPAPTPTTSTPSVEPTTEANPIVEPGMPSALPAPADVLDRTGPGWVLVAYRAASYPNPSDVEATAHAAFLVSPDGTRYRLFDLPPEYVVDVVSWTAADDRARVRVGPPNSEFISTGWLNLRTGALEPDEVDLPAERFFVGVLPDGTELWEVYPDAGPVQLYAVEDGDVRHVGELGEIATDAMPNPAGALVAAQAATADSLVVLDVATGERREVDLDVPDGDCTVLGWIDDSALLASCLDPVGDGPLVTWNPRLVRVDVVTSTLTTLQPLGVGEPFAPAHAAGANVSPGVIVFPGYTLDDEVPVASVCANGVWEWSSAGLRQLVAPGRLGEDSFSVEAVDGLVYAVGTLNCLEGSLLPELARIDGDGNRDVLIPAVDDAGQDGGWQWDHVLSWTAAR